MLILGALSTIQILFLPGYLFLKAVRLEGGALKTLILSISLSMTINNFIVILLVALNIYSGAALYAIFSVEALIFAWTIRKDIKTPIWAFFDPAFKGAVAFVNSSSARAARVYNTLLLFAALAAIGYFSVLAWENIGQIFHSWDAVASWNRWAEEWYHGRFPSNVRHYPQLLPTNWSLTYVFTGGTLQFFAKAIMPVFPLSILLIFFDLALRSRERGYMVAVVTSSVLFILLVGPQALSHGYADMPAAFMSFAPVYVLLSAGGNPGKTKAKHFMVGALCSAGAGLTKQSGLFMAALYPVLCHALSPGGMVRMKDRIVILSAVSLTVLALVAPWYVYSEARIHAGMDSSEISYVTDAIYQGKVLFERFASSMPLLLSTAVENIKSFSSFDPAFTRTCVLAAFSVMLGGIALGASRKTWRSLVFSVIVPYFLIWAFFFSYDLRNLSFVIPFAGGASGMGIQVLASFILSRFQPLESATRIFEDSANKRLLPGAFPRPGVKDISYLSSSIVGKSRFVTVALLLFAGAVTLAMANYYYDGRKLDARQLYLQTFIGYPEVNNMLYSYHFKYGLKGKILTNYVLMRHVPGLERFYKEADTRDPKSLRSAVIDPDSGYLLIIYVNVSPSVRDYIVESLKSGEFREIQSDSLVWFIEIMKKNR